MYSLTSAAVLAVDVARHPYAVGLADILDRALALRPHEAGTFGAPADDAVRQRVAAAATQLPSARQALGEVSSVLLGTDRGTSLAALAEAPLCSLTDLHALLRREARLLELDEAGLQVVQDAVTAVWVGPLAPFADRRAMLAPWEVALAAVPPPLPERHWTPRLRALLDDVPRRGEAEWQRSVDAHRGGGRRLWWSEAMHQACQAAVAAGRVRDVARAQLAGARALALTHTGTTAAGLVVAGAIQAVCTQDVVDSAVARALVTPWVAGT